MVKKNVGRKAGGAAGIAVVEDDVDVNEAVEAADEVTHETEKAPPKPKRKAAAEPASNSNFGVGEIRKAAAFANSIGGLDKAIALLQILKVAKEML